jgi:hypothetical protein
VGSKSGEKSPHVSRLMCHKFTVQILCELRRTDQNMQHKFKPTGEKTSCSHSEGIGFKCTNSSLKQRVITLL